MKNTAFLSLSILFLLQSCTNKQTTTMDITQLPAVTCAPVVSDMDWYSSDKVAPIIEGLNVYNFSVSTRNDLAQQYFNQGLVLAYGFNHAEAARSFHYATKLDPECAMAFWGFAFVLGPNYNASMEADNYERAYEAIQKALVLSVKNSSQKEKALIQALAKRYVEKPVEDRGDLDIAYSNAMEVVYNTYRNDPDIATLYAESIMDLHPWDLWDVGGNPKASTPKIISALEHALSIDPKHPGAHHFYIHAVEASFEPDKGLASAKLFDDGLVPGAGHLIHMPSHIYIRTGDYHLGSLSNIHAIEVDSAYVTACHAQGAYPLAYFPHNYHFLAATATLEGNSEWAIAAAKKVSAHSSAVLMKEPGWGSIQHYYTIPYNVYVKFGKWEEVLALANQDTTLIYPQAVRHYARGMAYLGLKKMDKAKAELQSLEIYAKDESLKEITIWEINSVDVLLQIAARVLKAEILAMESNVDASIALLKEAIKIEDDLNYNEPPDWFFSVRHHLGAIQIEGGYYEEAITTFEEDLKRLPKNGWALHGEKLAYTKLNNKVKVAEIENQLKSSWATADIVLSTSRIK